MSARQSSCGDPDYVRCPECQASRYERHLDPCSLRQRPQCQKRSLYTAARCDLSVGHDGAHIHFASNHTEAWGWPQPRDAKPGADL